MERLILLMENFKISLKMFGSCFFIATKWIFVTMKTHFCRVRSKVLHFLKEAGEESGILAISLMANQNLHPLERLLWCFIVIISINVAAVLIFTQYNRYLTSPTVIAVDRNYRGWNGTLPAVTLCYYDHIDQFKANEFILDVWNISVFDNDFQHFMNFLNAVVNASVDNYGEIAKFANDERFEDIDLFDLVRSIDRPFEQSLTSFNQDYEMQVLPVMTERGSCYAINSPMSAILTGSYVEFGDLKPPLICQYGKQQCYIKLDLYESTGTVSVHSPYEVATIDAKTISLQKSDEITASYKVMETVASKNLRELRVEQRKCVFHDEETASLKIYSQSLCLVRCRALMALDMCSCVPFFYPFVDGPSCNPDGFDCLLDFKWPVWALHICKCPSTCTEIEYNVQTVKKRTWGIKSNEDSLHFDVATSSFRWDLIPPKVRNRRDVVFSYEDLLVSYGGVLALFLGLSILCLCQLLFVLFWHILESFIDVLNVVRKAFLGICQSHKHRRALIQVMPAVVGSPKKLKGLNLKLKLKHQRSVEVHHKLSVETISEVEDFSNEVEDFHTEAGDQDDQLTESVTMPMFEFCN